LIFYHKILTPFEWVGLKLSCLLLTESSHYIVESSRYITRDCLLTTLKSEMLLGVTFLSVG